MSYNIGDGFLRENVKKYEKNKSSSTAVYAGKAEACSWLATPEYVNPKKTYFIVI